MTSPVKNLFFALLAAIAMTACSGNNNTGTPQTVVPYGVTGCTPGVAGCITGTSGRVHYQGYIGSTALNAGLARSLLGTAYGYIGGCYGSSCWNASTVDVVGTVTPNGFAWTVTLTFGGYSQAPTPLVGYGSYTASTTEVDAFFGAYKVQVISNGGAMDGTNPAVSAQILANGQLLSPASLVLLPY